MDAMILAAGRGERLRPYTDTCPKPLLEVRGKSLIRYHLEALAAAGFSRVVINLCWLGDLIEQSIGSDAGLGLDVVYSHESESLETAGGIHHALKYLSDHFLVINGDIYTDYRFENLVGISSTTHLVMVDNPVFHPDGDFALKSGCLTNGSGPRYTFSGIAQYSRSFFEGLRPGRQALAPLLRNAAEQQQLSGELFKGAWTDVGTVERWQSI